MGEFDLIKAYFKSSACAYLNKNISLGIGDDCALLRPSPQTEIAISTDTLVADVHFPASGDAFLIGQRALAVTVSDLAAMGANPIGFTLALTLPCVDQIWLKRFSEGLCLKAHECSISLMGGDTTKGPLSITVTVFGDVPLGKALRRDGAQVSDLLCVSGYLGEAAGALPMVLEDKPYDSSALLKSYWSPTPQLLIGQALLGKATACLDISDGLVADCGHIAESSNVALVIESSKLTISPLLSEVYDDKQCLQNILVGGDDYQLAFTVPCSLLPELVHSFPSIQVIGHVTKGSGISVVDEKGVSFELSQLGYQHF